MITPTITPLGGDDGCDLPPKSRRSRIFYPSGRSGLGCKAGLLSKQPCYPITPSHSYGASLTFRIAAGLSSVVLYTVGFKKLLEFAYENTFMSVLEKLQEIKIWRC
jgi:hypothetical protein